MANSIKETETEKNLMTAFIGESQARNRYTWFSSIARKEGLMQISAVFEETADQEKAHAKRFYQFLEGGAMQVTLSAEADALSTTMDNLEAAAKGENHEWETLYPTFADVADKEGFPVIAAAFRAISVSEKQHERRYRALLENIKAGRVFERNGVVTWRCRNCGYLHEGTAAPKVCPACMHPQAHFELLGENW
ncbi:Rubrerythrin [invertebrate metagenome]|uniref:Rubrerythrin n=1 Tax=invertebrate metagenome TaxID=1711999 RepID=A0A2H9TBY1_9ZZZZ